MEQNCSMAMRRGYDPTIPMPATLSRDASLVVENVTKEGHCIRASTARDGSIEASHRRSGCIRGTGMDGQPLPGHWTFIVRKGVQSLVVGIRASRPGGIGSG